MQILDASQTLDRTHVTRGDPRHAVPGVPTVSDSMCFLQSNARSFGALIFYLGPHHRMDYQAVKSRYVKAMSLGHPHDVARQRLRLTRSDPHRNKWEKTTTRRKLSDPRLPTFILFI